MNNFNNDRFSQSYRSITVIKLFLMTLLISLSGVVFSGDNNSSFTIKKAKWEAGDAKLEVEGKGKKGETVNIYNAATNELIAAVTVPKKKWKLKKKGVAIAPCRVRAEQSDGQQVEKKVSKAPDDCDSGAVIAKSEAEESELRIKESKWESGDAKLVAKGFGSQGETIQIINPVTQELFASLTVKEKEWELEKKGLPIAPCQIQAQQSDGQTVEKSVNNTPSDCDQEGSGHQDEEDDEGSNDGAKPKNAFNILMNYELGMHCTGFEFSYCCVLPPYNSILAQVVKTEKGSPFPELLLADPVVGLDFLGRPTVVRDTELDADGNFKKYVMRYWHEAQPRNDGKGAPQTDQLISLVEGNSLLMWNTVFDAAQVDANNALVTGGYQGADNVVLGDGDTQDDNDNYANAWLNHLYIYEDLEGANSTGTSLESDKIRLGMSNASLGFSTILPENSGPAFHPVGPGGGLNNVLTNSGDHGTVVYTQSKVLENLPVMLTAPRIWEALGLPLTPFEDTINFFGDPGAINESSIRPYVAMKAQLHHYDVNQSGGIGEPVLDSGNPVIGFGTAPIDIPNCERCHALGDGDSVNSAQNGYPAIAAKVQGEIEFWNAYYDISGSDSDWYSRLKGASISMLALHDEQHGTAFTANYDPQSNDGNTITRLGHETVLCQKCHADNVIAVVKSATHNGGDLIPPLSEAIHLNHKDNVTDDSLGRNGGCQGCHPAHRSDGDLAGYPIDELGLNAFAGGDNRDAAGGCYVGRDVHSNPGRNEECETPSHLNAVGQWLVDNVTHDSGGDKGIWCTNCHTQFSQELWKAENVESLVHAKPGDAGHVREPFAGATLADVAAAVGVSSTQAEQWLDPKNNDDTAAIWMPDPGLCDHVSGLFGGPSSRFQDANVATIEVSLVGQSCSTGFGVAGPDCDNNGSADFQICGSQDGDGDFSVNILDFCTTADCISDAQASLANSSAVPVPFSAATDGRDHWLAAGEPHCADCHAAPFVEQSGNINPYPPFNYPKKASLFRYSRGHQDITCQGCHESIHGLYPVTPDIDTTTYAQAASLNSDGSHGPLKCGACHEADQNGVASWADRMKYKGQKIKDDFDLAVAWSHTYTDEADPREAVCLNCHGNENDEIGSREEDWLEHAQKGRVSRLAMDKVEILQLGHVAGDPAFEDPFTSVCKGCHEDKREKVACSNTDWKEHLPKGRVAQSVWEYVSEQEAGSTCGW